MVGQRRHQDPEDDRNGLAELGGQDEREQLGLVADLREGDDTGRNQEGFHERDPRPGHRDNDARATRPGSALASSVSPSTVPNAPWPEAKCVDAFLPSDGSGYSPTKARIYHRPLTQLSVCCIEVRQRFLPRPAHPSSQTPAASPRGRRSECGISQAARARKSHKLEDE